MFWVFSLDSSEDGQGAENCENMSKFQIDPTEGSNGRSRLWPIVIDKLFALVNILKVGFMA